MRITEYLDDSGKSPFAGWFNALDAQAAAKITVYRIYFGREGDEVVILLAGGTKRRQQDDIRSALERWQDYKRRKKGG